MSMWPPVTSTGYNVFGWGVDPTDPTAIKQDTVQPLRLMIPENMVSEPEATTLATLSGVVDKKDTDVTGSGRVMDLEFYDKQGYKYTARLNVKKSNNTEPDDGKYQVGLMYVMDSKGTKVDLKGVKLGSADPLDIAADGTINRTADNTVELIYNTDTGTFQSVDGKENGKIDLTFPQDIGSGSEHFPASIQIDFSNTSNYNASGVSTMSIEKGGQGTNGVVGTGRAMGELSGFNIQKDGKIYATYDNGQEKLLGQIAVATFANPSGLSKEGDNLYTATTNSGEFNGIGEDITKSGYMTSGVLEMSNVDLAAEFTEMITTQRGFQANSRIITVSDTLLEELTNLKR